MLKFSYGVRTIGRWLVLAAVIGAVSGVTNGVKAAPQAKQPFLMGWYGGSGSDASLNAMAAEHASGANITVIYDDKDSVGDTLKAYLDVAAQNSLKVIVQIPGDWIGNADKKLFKPDLPSIQKLVNTFKGHPALYAWYLFDEPEYEQYPTGAQLQSLYAAIKQMDADHPVAMAFGNYSCWSYGSPASDSHIQDYVMAADLILFDQFPIFDQPELKPYLKQLPLGLTEDYHRIEDIPYMIDNCTGYLKTHHTPTYQGFVPILQAFKWVKADRYPTYSELRYMIYASLVRDVQGVMLWNNYWNVGQSDNTKFKQAVAYPLMQEVQSLATVAQNGVYDDPQITVDHPLSGPLQAISRNLYSYTLAYKFGSDGKSQYLIAISESRQTQAGVVFTLPAAFTAQTADVLFEGFNAANASYQARTISLTKNSQGQMTLTDTFAPFQVHVYRFN